MAKKRILITEDERPLAHAMELKLQNAGFEAIVANDGEEAIAELEKNPVDLILLDLVMPKADGFTVLRYLTENNNSTPTIIMSNLSQVEDQEKARELGATNFMIKSDTSLEELITVVKKSI